MATFDEIAQGYAKEVKAALDADKFSSESPITVNAVRFSRTASALKRIASDLDQYTIGGEPLSQSQRDEILRKAGQFLDSSEASAFPRAVRNASNDKYTDLVGDITVILK